MTINDILAQYNLSQSDLSRRYGIPLRTIQNWCGGVRRPPEYILTMIKVLLSHDL